MKEIAETSKKLGLSTTLKQGLIDASGLRDRGCRVAGKQAQAVLDTLRTLETNNTVPKNERRMLLNIFVTPDPKRNAYMQVAAHQGFWNNLSAKQRMLCVRNIYTAKTPADSAKQAERVRTLLGSTMFHTTTSAKRMWALQHLKRAAGSVSQSYLPAKIDIIKQAKGKLAQHLAEVKRRPYYTPANLQLARQTWKQAINTAKYCHDNWFKLVPHAIPVQTYGEFWNNTASYPNWYEKAQKVSARLGAASQRYIKP